MYLSHTNAHSHKHFFFLLSLIPVKKRDRQTGGGQADTSSTFTIKTPSSSTKPPFPFFFLFHIRCTSLERHVMSKGQVPKAPFTFLSSHFFTFFPLFLSAAPPNTSCTLVPLYFLACKSKTILSRVTPIMMMLMTKGKRNYESRQCSNRRHKANRFPAVIYSKALFFS